MSHVSVIAARLLVWVGILLCLGVPQLWANPIYLYEPSANKSTRAPQVLGVPPEVYAFTVSCKACWLP
ncbi:hypothetical protein MIV122R [Invertebrate iridescent virus 3]|uniref:Uncharacterized protein 122R n=1 Tax=Invertebrate iridescent virus 3 TaxID=345201 RepID=122R_IIV3|nr:hypothetical protein MIV122R [Invertebrate iridescent virus 3]Q196T8.1 RecName: Full=Uncharacterized protein 122R; Flags: Precursor [Invertebrate iridescent virus 3]ABF82152.1 hypothetical protein MIV122R [Invertebrate iridescent virus 3]